MDKIIINLTKNIMNEEKYSDGGEVSRKIDKILKENAALEAQLGLDIQGDERKAIKKKQSKLIAQIKGLDLDHYNIIEGETYEKHK